MRILVIEDSPPTRLLLQNSLEDAGHSVTFATRISSASKLVGAETFDVILIDIMLPDGSGLDLCREIRKVGIATPILFLTARGEVGDRIAGLDAGGDDYMRKPFALAELHARIRALTRRQGLSPPSLLERGSTRIDFTTRHLERDGREVPLTGREWEVLELLASRKGRIVRREELLEIAWHDVGQAASESLDVIVSRLRRKLSRQGEAGWIRTVRGQGYSLEIPR
jgi:two-component system, OmpR family, response regulator